MINWQGFLRVNGYIIHINIYIYIYITILNSIDTLCTYLLLNINTNQRSNWCCIIIITYI